MSLLPLVTELTTKYTPVQQLLKACAILEKGLGDPEIAAAIDKEDTEFSDALQTLRQTTDLLSPEAVIALQQIEGIAEMVDNIFTARIQDELQRMGGMTFGDV